MTIQNKTVTFLGAQAKVISYTVFPQADGSHSVTVSGTVSDGGPNSEPLAVQLIVPPGVATLDNMAARALTELRKANGLET